MDVSLKQQVREPNTFIGGRIHAARVLRGWSQTRLADHLGVTFQQVQKYERGNNRVSACTLVTIAKAMNLDVGFFFPAGTTTIGRGELQLMRSDLDAAMAAVDGAFKVLEPLRDRLRVAADRLSAAERDARHTPIHYLEETA